MASTLDRGDGETGPSWLNRLKRVDESALDPSELSHLRALREQAGREIVAEAVARRPGETAALHLARFHQVDKELLSIDQLLELSSHKRALEQEVNEQKRAARKRVEEPSASSSTTLQAGTVKALSLEQVKEAYMRLDHEAKRQFSLWLANGCPRTDTPTP